jgi:hypothetical protein
VGPNSRASDFYRVLCSHGRSHSYQLGDTKFSSPSTHFLPIIPGMLQKIILSVLLADSLWLICGGSGLFVGNTQDTTILAMCLPLFWAWNKGLILLPFLAIARIKGETSICILAVLALYYNFELQRTQGIKWRYRFIPFIPAIYSIFAVYPMFRENRMKFWAPYIIWWLEKANPWVGTGLGSFEWISATQNIRQLDGRSRMWLHSDWLQILFETGIVGFLASFALYFLILLRLTGHNRAYWLALGVAMMTYSPVQFWPIVLLCVLVIKSEKTWSSAY